MDKPQVEEWKGICAIDCETTGLDAYHNEVIEIAIVPLHANFTVNSEIPPFRSTIRPENAPETIEDGALKVNGKKREELETFPKRIEVVKEFVAWWEENVGKRQLKNIVPLGHNYNGFDKDFIKAFLDPKTRVNNAYGAFFHYHCHDSMTTAMYLNARQAVAGMKPQFYSVSLGAVCKRLGIVNEQAHSACGDAVAAAAVYQRLCQL